jgi:hypothetical protein
MKFLRPSKEQQERLLKAIEDLPDGPQKRFFKEKAEGEAVTTSEGRTVVDANKLLAQPHIKAMLRSIRDANLGRKIKNDSPSPNPTARSV